jgi:hypothetical protein
MSTRRLFWTAFVVGALLPFPAAALALLWQPGEVIAPLVTPGIVLLLPLVGLMQDWPAAVNMVLASLANGLVAGVLALVVRRVWGMLRRRRRTAAA